MPYYVNRIQNGNELYHHGILGQKWGVRRFQNADGSRTSAGKQRYAAKIEKYNAKEARLRDKADNAKTNIGRTVALSRAYRAKYKADRTAAVANETTLMGKAKQRFGDAAAARSYATAAQRDAEIAKGSTSWRQIRARETSAYNNEQLSDTYSKRAKQNTAAKIGQGIVLNALFTPVFGHEVAIGGTKMKTIDGRETKRGAEIAAWYFTSGLGNLAMDAVHYTNNYDSIRSENNRRKEQAKANKEARKAKNSGE